MNFTKLVSLLSEFGASAPSIEAFELCRHVYGVSKEWCISNRFTEFSPSNLLDSMIEYRRSGIPLQYILGEAWFYGNRFIVSEACLIPQPDTEHLVELALKHLSPDSKFVDLCTGSGCVAISILLTRDDTSAVGVDISIPALKIAEQNSKLHGVSDRIRLIHADVMNDEIFSYVSDADVIVSNPPYINTDSIQNLSSEVQCEPRIALDGGTDGLDFYRRFICQLAHRMKPEAVMFLEIGFDQHERIRALCQNQGLKCSFHTDFGGNVRVCEIHRVNAAKL